MSPVAEVIALQLGDNSMMGLDIQNFEVLQYFFPSTHFLQHFHTNMG